MSSDIVLSRFGRLNEVVLLPCWMHVNTTVCAFVVLFLHNFTLRPSLLGTVRIENTHHCTILLGPTCTSVYIEDSSHLTVFIACHQLRMHKTTDCQLYVRVNSHPIIEDCSNMGFAPYSYNYEGIEQDFVVSSWMLYGCCFGVVCCVGVFFVVYCLSQKKCVLFTL